MRLTRMRITMAAGLLAVSGTVAATVVAVAPASAVSTAVVMVNCAGQGQVRPGGYDIGCTANEMLASLHWQTWRGTAYGNGVLKVDNCVPTCAQGSLCSGPCGQAAPKFRASRTPVQCGASCGAFQRSAPTGGAA